MAALEERFQAELFTRSPRGLELTEAGESILEPARQMEQEVQALELAITGRDRALAGTVRITATEGIAVLWMTPQLAAFQAEHPDVATRVIVGLVCVAVPALGMGLGFPLGLRLIQRRRELDGGPELGPWLWGINGAAGVCASGLALGSSMAWGTYPMGCPWRPGGRPKREMVPFLGFRIPRRRRRRATP